MEASTRHDDPGRWTVASAEPPLGVAEALAVAANGLRIVAPGPLWVQGEVEGFVQSRAGHWYRSLTGDGARLPTCCLGREATAVAATLARAQVELGDGLTVRVRGSLGVYSPRGQVQLRVFDVDAAVSVGAGVLARREVRARLAAAGLLGLQRALRPALCPLRVGGLAPAGQGLEDLMAVLERAERDLAGAEAAIAAGQGQLVAAKEARVAADSAPAAAQRSARNARLAVLLALALAVVIVVLVLAR